MYTKSQPVLIVFSILAALQFATAGTALADVIGDDLAKIIILAVGTLQVGMAFYVKGVVTPVADVAAYVDSRGNTVAGPSSEPRDGSLVEVVASSHREFDEYDH